MKSKSSNAQGFTLIEVLVSAAVLGLLLVGVYGMYIYINDYYNTADYLLELQRRGPGVLAEITRELKEAEAVTLTDVDIYSIAHGIDDTIRLENSDIPSGGDGIADADFWITDEGDLFRRLRWEDDTGATTADVTEMLIDAGNSDLYVESLEFDYDAAVND